MGECTGLAEIALGERRGVSRRDLVTNFCCVDVVSDYSFSTVLLRERVRTTNPATSCLVPRPITVQSPTLSPQGPKVAFANPQLHPYVSSLLSMLSHTRFPSTPLEYRRGTDKACLGRMFPSPTCTVHTALKGHTRFVLVSSTILCTHICCHAVVTF